MNNPSQSDLKNILIVDDEIQIFDVVEAYLCTEPPSYQLWYTSSGHEALEFFQMVIPDMILCDIMMPGMNGIEFLKRVRQDPRTAWIPFMFLSALWRSEDRVRGLNAGADFYMVKPINGKELRAQVAAALNQFYRIRNLDESSRIDESSQVPSDDELTPTELKVGELVAQGMSNKEIAEKLSLSQRTVESHVSNMLIKTNLNNRTELVRWFIENENRVLVKADSIIRNQVFISYSHQDSKMQQDLLVHLTPHIRQEAFKVWVDTQIRPGEKWEQEIEQALASAKVAVLLVSPYFLFSPFIGTNELPPLLDAAEKEGLTILWIPISASGYKRTEIAKYQAAHPPEKPLDGLTSSRRKQAWVKICEAIEAAMVSKNES